MKAFSGDTPYSIMFGPDICGSMTRKVHVIINYKGENHELKSPITAETDQLSHVYTLVIRSDASFEVLLRALSSSSILPLGICILQLLSTQCRPFDPPECY